MPGAFLRLVAKPTSVVMNTINQGWILKIIGCDIVIPFKLKLFGERIGFYARWRAHKAHDVASEYDRHLV